MNQNTQIQLNLESFLDVPLEAYSKDFTFIVNGEEFKTSRIIADLLSPTISKLHLTDPTIDKFIINTQQHGNFTIFLNLIDFEQKELSEEDALFISEIIEILGNKSLSVKEPDDIIEITKDNIFDRITLHSKLSNFYSSSLQNDIDYISSHFFELCDDKVDDLKKLSVLTLQRILSNPKLILSSEDQLVIFINQIYKNNSDYSVLYGYVNFSCISKKSISNFLSIFDINDITLETWKKLSLRLENINSSPSECGDRYCQKEVQIMYQKDKDFNGIINYLRTLSKGNIFNLIEINTSSVLDSRRCPNNVIIYDNKDKYFSSKNEVNSWISFDFKNYQVTPTNYTIQSFPCSSNGYAHPKSWNIEGSNDNTNWEIIDRQEESSVLNGESVTYTFPIGKDHKKAFRYLRMRITGQNWGEIDTLCISAIEFYGILNPISS